MRHKRTLQMVTLVASAVLAMALLAAPAAAGQAGEAIPLDVAILVPGEAPIVAHFARQVLLPRLIAGYDQVAVILFNGAGESQLLAPLSGDFAQANAALYGETYGSRGSAGLAAALKAGQSELMRPREGRQAAPVLIVAKASPVDDWPAALQAARAARAAGIRIISVAVGTGANPEQLGQLPGSQDDFYLQLNPADLERTFQDIAQRLGRPPAAAVQLSEPRLAATVPIRGGLVTVTPTFTPTFTPTPPPTATPCPPPEPPPPCCGVPWWAILLIVLGALTLAGVLALLCLELCRRRRNRPRNEPAQSADPEETVSMSVKGNRFWRSRLPDEEEGE